MKMQKSNHQEIEEDFRIAYQGIVKLPMEEVWCLRLCLLQKLLTKLKTRLITR
jgi:hypothetical protein